MILERKGSEAVWGLGGVFRYNCKTMRAACRDDVKIDVKNEVVRFTGSDDVCV